MRIGFVLIILIHALVHLLGFIKGFGLKEVRELTLPISKPMGMLWLLAALLLLAYAVGFHLKWQNAYWLGLLAALISQILIIVFWKEAKFGTLPNVLIIAVAVMAWSGAHFTNLVSMETKALINKQEILEPSILKEEDTRHLPKPVRLWLRNSGTVGKPFQQSGKIFQRAKMQMKPGQKTWMEATAIQQTTINRPAFIWSVEAAMNDFLYFLGRDKFENGKGEMLIKMNGLINIVNERGPKLDEASMQRYLGEMVWFPSFALSPYLQWEEINENSAQATMTYKGTKATGTFYFNAQGDVVRFTALRYKGNEENAKKYGWEMHISDYNTFAGIKVPSKMTSVWKLDEGDWKWLELEVSEINYNLLD